MNDPPKRATSRAPPAITSAASRQGLRARRGRELAISDLAREFAITTRAIRFYEARGLMHPARKGTARVFGPEDRRRLALIIRAKNLGLTLEEIGEHLSVFDRHPAVGDVAMLKGRADRQIALLSTKRADLNAALADLRKLSAAFAASLRRTSRSKGR